MTEHKLYAKENKRLTQPIPEQKDEKTGADVQASTSPLTVKRSSPPSLPCTQNCGVKHTGATPCSLHT